MANPYEFIIGGELPSEDKTRILANKLRGADDRAILAMMSGDPVLTNVGQQTMARTQNRAQGLSKSRQNISQRRAANQRHQEGLESQANLQDERLNQDAAQHGEMMDYRYAKLVNDLKVARAEREREAAEKEQEKAKEAQEELRKEGVIDLEASMNELDFLLNPYAKTDESGRLVSVEGNVPGMGATNWLPNALLSDEGAQIKSAMSSVANRVLKARSGAAVTTPEMKRLANELQNSIGVDDAQTIRAYLGLKRHTQAVRQAVLQGFTAESLEDLKRLDQTILGEDPGVVNRPGGNAQFEVVEE